MRSATSSSARGEDPRIVAEAISVCRHPGFTSPQQHITLNSVTHKSDVTLERLRTFLRVAERGSFSAVARDLGVGQSTISRRVLDLEEALGVSLVSRTTRSVALTDEGRDYYPRAAEILRLVDEATESLDSLRGKAAGRVRVACSAFFGVMHLCRLIFAFQDRYPQIHVDFLLTDDRSDMVRDGVDIAIQIGDQPDSTLRLRPLGQSCQILVASPQYLAERGTPRDPQALADHDIIRRTGISRGNELALIAPDGTTRVVAVSPRLRVDHGLAVREALTAGRGIAPVPEWLVDDLIDADRLHRVLPRYSCAPSPLHMLIVPERASVTRVALLRDYLAREIMTIPGVAAP